MLRIGAVSYLNTKPLIEGLGDEITDRAKLTLDIPSQLACQLASGELDVALVPSVEYLRCSDWKVVSNAVIACRGPVWSVRLLSHVRPEEIRVLALDVGSRTSAALVQVLLWESIRNRPRLVPLPLETPLEHVQADAMLVIGDRAMDCGAREYLVNWDLGERWCQWTGLPFVFAMWVARSETDTSQVESWLTKSRDLGLQRLTEIAKREAPRHRLSTAVLERYFRENLYFYLGEREQQGLDAFRRKSVALNLIGAECASHYESNSCIAR
jgi:chorismate dehydratase